MTLTTFGRRSGGAHASSHRGARGAVSPHHGAHGAVRVHRNGRGAVPGPHHNPIEHRGIGEEAREAGPNSLHGSFEGSPAVSGFTRVTRSRRRRNRRRNRRGLETNRQVHTEDPPRNVEESAAPARTDAILTITNDDGVSFRLTSPDIANILFQDRRLIGDAGTPVMARYQAFPYQATPQQALRVPAAPRPHSNSHSNADMSPRYPSRRRRNRRRSGSRAAAPSSNHQVTFYHQLVDDMNIVEFTSALELAVTRLSTRITRRCGQRESQQLHNEVRSTVRQALLGRLHAAIDTMRDERQGPYAFGRNEYNIFGDRVRNVAYAASAVALVPENVEEYRDYDIETHVEDEFLGTQQMESEAASLPIPIIDPGSLSIVSDSSSTAFFSCADTAFDTIPSVLTEHEEAAFISDQENSSVISDLPFDAEFSNGTQVQPNSADIFPDTSDEESTVTSVFNYETPWYQDPNRAHLPVHDDSSSSSSDSSDSDMPPLRSRRLWAPYSATTHSATVLTTDAPSASQDEPRRQAFAFAVTRLPRDREETQTAIVPRSIIFRRTNNFTRFIAAAARSLTPDPISPAPATVTTPADTATTEVTPPTAVARVNQFAQRVQSNLDSRLRSLNRAASTDSPRHNSSPFGTFFEQSRDHPTVTTPTSLELTHQPVTPNAVDCLGPMDLGPLFVPVNHPLSANVQTPQAIKTSASSVVSTPPVLSPIIQPPPLP